MRSPAIFNEARSEVEKDEWCASVLVKRMEDGLLPQVPVWPDVQTFNVSGATSDVEIITGGFPCQAGLLLSAFSVSTHFRALGARELQAQACRKACGTRGASC